MRFAPNVVDPRQKITASADERVSVGRIRTDKAEFGMVCLSTHLRQFAE